MPDADADLRERVADLEHKVEAQQATIQQLLPSRRRVLQAGGLLAGGGVLGALTADRASADVTGQVGTSQDRVDVFAGAVDANSVKTGQMDVGSTQTINNLDFGSVSVPGPAASSNADFSDSSTEVATITFSTTFDNVPRIALGGISGNRVGLIVLVDQQTTTDARIVVNNYSTFDYSSDALEFDYIAIS